MNNIAETSLLAAILTGTFLLSGCTVMDTAPTDTKPAATQSVEAPAAEAPAEEKPATVDEVVKLEVGTTLTDAQAVAIKRNKTAKAYTLPSGEKVLVKDVEAMEAWLALASSPEGHSELRGR